MRARGMSRPRTAPCSLVTVQHGHAMDKCSSALCQPMSFPIFAHSGIHGVRVGLHL